jgi:hypothetical protein
LLRTLTTAAWTVLATSLLAACERSEPPAREPPRTVRGVIDWQARIVELNAPGWTFSFCRPDPRFLCVARAGDEVGYVEATGRPVDNFPALQERLAAGAPLPEALAGIADQLARSVREDRRGIGRDYDVVADSALPASIGGWEAVRTGLTVTRGGSVVERYVQYRGVVRDVFILLTAAGAADPAATPEPAGTFLLEELDAFLPVFDLVAEVSRF